jgi:hypothetical protein
LLSVRRIILTLIHTPDKINVAYLVVLLISGQTLVSAASVDDGVVYGYVYDAETNEFISSAFVRSQEGQNAPTNAEGYYEIKGCSPSTSYTLTCYAPGYKSSSKAVTTYSDGKLEVDFYLQSEDSVSISKQDDEPGGAETATSGSGSDFDYAQTTWSKTFGGSGSDRGMSVQEARDGGFIITGWTSSYGAGNADVWLIKTNSNGDKMWDRTFGGPKRDFGCSVQETFDGGFIIAATTESYTDKVGSVWLIKTDPEGNKIWDKTYSKFDWNEARTVQETSDGGYIILGTTFSAATHKGSFWLVKTDPDGNNEWDRIFGDSAHDIGYSVLETEDGSFVLAGKTETYGAGSRDLWLIKTNSDGNIIWDKTFGGSETDGAYSLQPTKDGGYIITGWTASYGVGGEDLWLVKTDSSGNKEWDRTFGGPEDDGGNFVLPTEDGGYVVTGGKKTDQDANLWIVKTDSAGNNVWDRTFGGSGEDWGWSLLATRDGGYIITGGTESYGAGNSDVWLIKIDSEGNCDAYPVVG